MFAQNTFENINTSFHSKDQQNIFENISVSNSNNINNGILEVSLLHLDTLFTLAMRLLSLPVILHGRHLALRNFIL